MTTALILLNGEIANDARVRRRAKNADFIIATDGGLRHAVRLKIRPDIVIGDMDSLPKPLPKGPETAYYCDFDEDRSDFEKALSCLQDLGIRTAEIAGMAGGRLDHTLVNAGVIEKWAKKLRLTVVDPGTASVLGPGRHTLPCRKGAVVTLLPVTGTCRLSTKGLKYPLKNELLRRGSRGLGNCAVAAIVELRIRSGRLWVFLPDA